MPGAERIDHATAGIYKVTGSGAKLDRSERKKVTTFAQARQFDVILVTELPPGGDARRSIFSTHCAIWKAAKLERWKVSVIAMSGMTFDLSMPHARMLATFLSGIAEFERDLIRKRVKSGLAAANARGRTLGRQLSQRSNPTAVARDLISIALWELILDRVCAGG
jgi:putative DNA-invertase from lambdoid prophage Rac